MTLPALSRRKENPGRVYVRPSTQREVKSVTNITGRKDKSGPLVGWAVKHSGNKGAELLGELAALVASTEPDDLRMLQALVKQKYGTKKALYEAARTIKGARFDDRATASFSASNAGTLVHDVIEHHVHTGKPRFSYSSLKQIIEPAGITEAEALSEIMPWFVQYLAFERRFKPEWLLLEATVWNDTLGYAGTLDGVMRLPNGRVYLVDFKTGNGVYSEYGMQLEALARGEFIIDPETGEETPMIPVDALAILHIRPEFAELHEVRRHEKVWKAFLGLIDVAEFDDISQLVLGTSSKTVAEEEFTAIYDNAREATG